MPSLQEIQLAKPANKLKMGYYVYEDKKYPVPINYQIQTLATNILKANKNNTYTSIVITGKSGSGKTVLCQTLCHRLSCMNKNNERYAIKYFKALDLLNLDSIIKELRGAERYIMVFDDISFIMEQADNKTRKKLANALTTIRHDVKGHVISMMVIHYQRALIPMMRDADYRVITSMSDQDAQNWKQTLGWSHRFAIDQFQRQYAFEMQNGFFFVKNKGGGQDFKYQTNKPFRVGLVSEFVGLHQVLIPMEGCNNCRLHQEEYRSEIDPQLLYDTIKKHYPADARGAIQYWLYFVKGNKRALPSTRTTVIRFLEKTLARKWVNDEELAEIVNPKGKGHATKKALEKLNEGLTNVGTS